MESRGPEVGFRRLLGRADYPLLLAVAEGSRRADRIAGSVSPADVERACTPADGYDPAQDVLRPLPAGLEVGAVRPEHFRTAWDVQREETRALSEPVAEDWTEDKYPAWRDRPSHTPDLWQVAWDGDRLAGMVLARIDAAENEERGRRRGYTEHIFVRRPWRRRGLASALIASSLRALKAQGMNEAELGVDSESQSGALGRSRPHTFAGPVGRYNPALRRTGHSPTT